MMRTSRIANETSKITQQISPTKASMRPQTRNFAQSLRSYSANGLPITKTEEEVEETKSEITRDHDSSELSSAGSTFSADIEDLPVPRTDLRKRKRGANTPSIITPSVATSNALTFRRKAGMKVKKQPAKKVTNEDGHVEIPPPPHWEEIYEAVKEMRKKVLAPVDTMGCETLAEEHSSPRDKRFQTLIALMLSSQTKDTTNAIAMRRLQTELPPPGLTIENILAVSPEKLNELIWVVGFHNNKTRYIKATALILRDQWESDIPGTVEGLKSLPGVGPKMAYLCMSAAWGRTEGIGVDVHVHRITNLWGWHKTRMPEETRATLEAWLPKDKWHEINHLLVGFGQTICLPIGRRCGECDLSQKGLCPSAVVEKKDKSRKRTLKEIKVNSDEAKLEIKEETVDTDVETQDLGKVNFKVGYMEDVRQQRFERYGATTR